MPKMKKLFTHAARVLSVLLLVLTAAGSLPVSAAAPTRYISEITVAVGPEGRSSLESRGYSVLFQGMNLVSGDEGSVYLGYKKGSNAITGLVVSTQRSQTISYDGASYSLVSDDSLNYGTDGTALYLYCTRDDAAGEKITSLDTASGFSSTDEVLSLRNDGSAPVRMSDGTLANLDRGISNSEIYLLMYRAPSVKCYISDVCLVSGGTKAEAINRAASLGCDSYVDKDIGGRGEVAYLAYSRTADAEAAITGFTLDSGEVLIERDGQSGARLIDITDGRLFGDSFEFGDWAGVYASYDRAISRHSSLYKTLSASTQACSSVAAGDDDLYALYEGSYTAAADEETEEPEESEEASEEPEAAPEPEASEEPAADAVDEFYDIDKSADEADTVDEAADGEEDTGLIASVFNSGNLVAISCISMIIVLTLIGSWIYIKDRNSSMRKQKGQQGGKK